MMALLHPSSDTVVDLGYQLNQGHSIHVQTGNLIAFRYIRYARAPIGDLRFRAPAKPLVNRTNIQDHEDVIPPQAYPAWLLAEDPPTDPRISEDCLFLDVLVPSLVWENRHSSNTRAAVLVWVPGGGFVVGWKDASGAGHGLVARSSEDNKEGVILVSINYRLGLFGWMHGEDVIANAGLQDQRFALNWVQDYIRLLGGDKNKVTILAESAGAGCLHAHITAPQHSRPRFNGAISQSPFDLPKLPSPESHVNHILAREKISSVRSLRNLSSEKLQQINSELIRGAQPIGNFIFGIVPDKTYVPDLPNRRLLAGSFDPGLSIMTGHNQDEGSRFVPRVTSDQDYEDHLKKTFTSLEQFPEQLAKITKDLYPPIFDGSQGYMNQTERMNLTIADAMFICNTRTLDTTPFNRNPYAYEYTVPPAVHGADLEYTFYDFGHSKGLNTTVAVTLQKYITNFAQTKDPNGQGLPQFESFNRGEVVQNIGVHGIGPKPDEGCIEQLAARCDYWQRAPYLEQQ